MLSFIASLVTSNYQTAVADNLHSYVWNRAITHVPYSKFWTYLIVLSEPLLYQALNILQFFINLTLQLQFIIPQFAGSLLAEIPFSLKMLGLKTYG